jgi:ArsR family transcriptional regulator
MSRLDSSQSRMSRHWHILRKAGLITDRRWVRHRLNSACAPETARLAAVMAALEAERTAA